MISLKAVRSPDEGDYTCEATNIARDADGNVIVVNKSVRLSVKCEYVYLVYSPLSHPIRYIYITVCMKLCFPAMMCARHS